jgi:hypothetical protein
MRKAERPRPKSGLQAGGIFLTIPDKPDPTKDNLAELAANHEMPAKPLFIRILRCRNAGKKNERVKGIEAFNKSSVYAGSQACLHFPDRFLTIRADENS